MVVMALGFEPEELPKLWDTEGLGGHAVGNGQNQFPHA